MNQEEIITTKVAVEWCFASLYFEVFAHTIRGKVFADEKFQKMFNEIMTYISEQVETSMQTDILDTYVVVEQKRE
ncbi:MAG: hypothetical protein J6C79_01660 [Clostridia bacterium]|nr:hypothetical protein [Clostridia bacterium]